MRRILDIMRSGCLGVMPSRGFDLKENLIQKNKINISKVIFFEED
jgi:hypothetical protein